MPNRLIRPLAVIVTLTLLALLAQQCARLFWHLATEPPSVSAPTISAQSTPQTPWFSNIIIQSDKRQQVAQTTAAKPTLTSKKTPAPSITQNWRLKGVYAETGDSIAIIQTDAGSHVVEVGDAVADGFIVTKITPTQVLIRGQSDELSLKLANRHLDELANTTYGSQLPPRTPIATTPTANVPVVPFQETDWLTHLFIKPMLENGQPAFEIAANNETGEGLLRGVGLQSGDVILRVDGQAPTHQAWRAVATKLRKAQKIRAKIKRRGTIQTITIKR